jgi:hypothetical protein
MNALDNAKQAAKSFMAGAYPDRVWFLIGGALRDTDLGVDMRDVDIFVSGYDTDPDPEDCEDDGERNAYLLRAYTQPWMGVELNLVFLRGEWDLERATDRCDFGICQIGYDPVTDRTYRSNAYNKDRLNKTFTLCLNTVPERKDRLSKKFPDFRYRNPELYKLTWQDATWHYNAETRLLEKKYITQQ